jgi:hypothetical protein
MQLQLRLVPKWKFYVFEAGLSILKNGGHALLLWIKNSDFSKFSKFALISGDFLGKF